MHTCDQIGSETTVHYPHPTSTSVFLAETLPVSLLESLFPAPSAPVTVLSLLAAGLGDRSLPLTPGGGVSLLDTGGVGVVARALGTPFAHHLRPLRMISSRAFSSRLFSKAVLYRSYPSLNDLSTRDEKMSSPRGLAEGGICAMTVDGPLTLRLEFRAATGGLFGGSGAGLAFAGGDGARRNGRGSSDKMHIEWSKCFVRVVDIARS